MLTGTTLSVLGLAVVLLVLTRFRCAHVDDDGRSLLLWTYAEGHAKGECLECGRLTTGWETSAPRPARQVHAQAASVEEIAASRARRHARERTAARMRRSSHSHERTRR